MGLSANSSQVVLRQPAPAWGSIAHGSSPLLPLRALGMGEKQKVCTFPQGRIKSHATLFTINIGYCLLVHSAMSLKACQGGKLHYSTLKRPSCRRRALGCYFEMSRSLPKSQMGGQGATPPPHQHFLRTFHRSGDDKQSKTISIRRWVKILSH